MRVLLVTDYFYPQSSGGTEKYVYELAQGLHASSVNVVILTIAESSANYFYKEFEVHTIPANTNNSKDVIGGISPGNNIAAFAEKLDELRPDVIHFHTLTTSISVFHYETAKLTGAKIVLTSHIPGNTCLRGDLMRYGKEICDGKVRLNTCLSCYLNARGIPELVSSIIAPMMRTLKQPPILSQASVIKKHHLEIIKDVCSKVVTMSNWQQDVFMINGFAPEQLVLSRHTFKQLGNYSKANTNHPVVVGYAGRVSPEKGLHILIEAFKRLDTNKFILLIAAIKVPAQGQYFDKLFNETRNLPNVKWSFDYNADTIDTFYKELDLLCIPSVCNETGPYVMFESIARHIPVIASNLGGMKEWSGLNYPVTLYNYDNAEHLYTLLKDFSGSTYTSSDYPPEKNVALLAKEMMDIYAND